jgi:hypothetical protein
MISPGGCSLAEGDSITNCSGVMIGDDHWYRYNFTCRENDYLHCTDYQTVNISGWGCMLKYERKDYLGPYENPRMDYQDIGCP